VINQVRKNASCHDDKMEAYCNAVQALEDKFYDIELNHVPRRYNEEADELAKIASGRITVAPNVFLREMSPGRSSTSSRPLEPGGTLRGSLRPNKRRAYGRGPHEQGVCTLPARGVWRG
jgi:hypothetical protein